MSDNSLSDKLLVTVLLAERAWPAALQPGSRTSQASEGVIQHPPGPVAPGGKAPSSSFIPRRRSAVVLAPAA
ncbi:MAG: hypothetical protein FWG25_03190 [Promicromonosporaceae bacterium]|nr:hypothetical protein [Promicromonosporaceae bacterium]